MKMEYVILYDDDCYKIIDAVSFKDCILQVADFFGDNTELFGKALNGCTTDSDMVRMLNHFSSYEVNAVYELSRKVY